MDPDFNSIYSKSLQRNDNLAAAARMLQEYEGFFKIILHEYLLDTLQAYINFKGECETKSTVRLAQIVPETFSACFRQAIGNVLDKAEDGDTHAADVIQWLRKNHLEQLLDTETTREEIKSESTSPEGIKREKAAIERLEKYLKSKRNKK